MKIIDKVFYDLCNSVSSPVSLGLWIRYCYAPKEYATATINPLDYNDSVSFSADYCCVSFLRKYVGLNTGLDKREEALLKFRKAEEKCQETNERLRRAQATGRLDRTDPAILARAQELMRMIWGKPSFDDLFSRSEWGPGATESLKGNSASREHKMSQFPVSLTPTAEPFFSALIKTDILWLRHLLKQDVVGPTSLLRVCYEFTNSSRLLTVPKDARADRVISAEPSGNIYLQKGVGAWIRSQLRSFGIDLNSQTRNQNLAKLAYWLGLATLDLKSASDLIAIMACKLLCPSDMFNLLDRLRSPAYGTDDSETRFHKFSSMGNGFTFELESMMFYCLVRAVKEHAKSENPIGVYGDDIICGQEIASNVIEVLEDFGFSINEEKSFISGKFFESCGKHYFEGDDVTPVYQKNLIDGDLEYIRMHNRLFDWSQRACTRRHPRKEKFGHILTRLIRERSDTLRKVECFGLPWMQGDGFFKVFKPEKMPFCMNHGYKLTFLSAHGPARLLADGGLYANSVRSSARGGYPEVVKCDDSYNSQSRQVKVNPYFALTVADSVITSTPSYGYVDLRPQSRVTRYRVRTRWVPSCFGEAASYYESLDA